MSAQGIVSTDSLWRLMVSTEARNILSAVTKGGAVEFHYGVHWTWTQRAGELLTEAGCEVLETAYKGAEMHTEAAIIRELIEAEKRVTTPPAMQLFATTATAAPAARTRRLPYADPDLEDPQ